MKKFVAMLLAVLMMCMAVVSASAEVRVTEYLKDASANDVMPFDTSKPKKKWDWADGVYVGSLIGVKSWTYTQYTFTPTSSGKLYIYLQCGAGVKDENFKVTVFDASTGEAVETASFAGNSNGAVLGSKHTFSGLDKNKQYYFRFKHGSKVACLSGSFLYVNNSSTFNL